MAFFICYVTHPDEACARRIGNAAVEQRLAACANYFPIGSAYWWDGAVQQEGEWVSLLKTSTARMPALEAFILSEHPYDTPCVMRLTANANIEYENWIEASTRGV
ncbi:MAG: divalent-cation tolerance protein CutA [Chitinophagales bacterium]|nr:divalent-cation tolerance protein CutA [Chitinophagales bacterium]